MTQTSFFFFEEQQKDIFLVQNRSTFIRSVHCRAIASSSARIDWEHGNNDFCTKSKKISLAASL